jgi:hypothetical protein
VILRGWTLCFDANSMPLLQLLLAATGVVTLIVICHRRGFRGDSPGMDLATLDTRDGRRRYNSSRQRETGTAALSADMGRRMNPIRAGSASQCPSPCVGLDWRARFQNQTEPFSLRRTCAGSAVITRGVSRACWASLWKQRYFRSESRPYSMWRDR